MANIVLSAEFGGKGERISRDGLRDGVTRRWGDGGKKEMRDEETLRVRSNPKKGLLLMPGTVIGFYYSVLWVF